MIGVRCLKHPASAAGIYIGLRLTKEGQHFGLLGELDEPLIRGCILTTISALPFKVRMTGRPVFLSLFGYLHSVTYEVLRD